MTLEGVLGPNDRIEVAVGVRVAAPQALCVTADGRLLYSTGSDVFALGVWGGQPELFASFDRPVTALCASPGGLVAIGMAGARVAVCDAAGRVLPGWVSEPGLRSVVDCAFLSEDELVVVDSGYGADEDLLSIAPWDDAGRGQVVALGRSGTSRVLASGCHCPMGVARDQGGALILSLFERACVIELSGKVRQAGYPAYLGRIRRVAGGYVMACLGRRDALIEFLKTEREFVTEMKARIEPRHWISPRPAPVFSHDFPIELGATRLFGEVKPWAPSFSYGLIIEMDENLMPVASAHSRANGRRHAISDVASWSGALIAVSKASGEILNLGAGGKPQ